MFVVSCPDMTLGGYINVRCCALIHSRPRVLQWLSALVFCYSLVMDEAKFKVLMDEICQSHNEAHQSQQKVEQKLSISAEW